MEEKWTLKSQTGILAQVTSRGAALTALYAPDSRGNRQNIVYRDSAAFGGAVVAPVAGRVRGGAVAIGGKRYAMPCGEDGVCLHSGPQSTAQKQWSVAAASERQIVFQTVLKHGECGLPGRRELKAIYNLCGDTLELAIRITADRDTFVNPTSHIYWNLSGDFTRPAAGHELLLPASEVWYNNEKHLPTALHGVEGTPFDFNTPRSWLSGWGGEPQLELAHGYNHAFVLRQNAPLQLMHPASGRRLSLETNASHLVFYSGGYLPQRGCALAFEPQLVPDAPRLLQNRLPVLRAGQEFYWAAKFRFDTI